MRWANRTRDEINIFNLKCTLPTNISIVLVLDLLYKLRQIFTLINISRIGWEWNHKFTIKSLVNISYLPFRNVWENQSIVLFLSFFVRFKIFNRQRRNWNIFMYLWKMKEKMKYLFYNGCSNIYGRQCTFVLVPFEYWVKSIFWIEDVNFPSRRHLECRDYPSMRSWSVPFWYGWDDVRTNARRSKFSVRSKRFPPSPNLPTCPWIIPRKNIKLYIFDYWAWKKKKIRNRNIVVYEIVYAETLIYFSENNDIHKILTPWKFCKINITVIL